MMIRFGYRERGINALAFCILLMVFLISPLFAQVAQNHVKAGRRYINQGKYPEAEKSYRAAIEADSAYLEAYRNLIDLKRRLKDPGAIVSIVEEALRRNPVMDISDKGHFHRIAARACLENNLFMEAFRHIEKARDYLGESEAISADFKVIKQKLANYVDELIGKANQAFEQNELEKAISLYSQVLKIDPENGEIYQKFKESRDLFTKEVSLNAALETLSKAEVLLRQEQWDEAVSLLDEAKSKAPWSDDVKQRVEAGKQVYQKYLDRIKVNEEAKQQKEEHKRQEAYYLERAKLFLMEENWDKAIEFYRKVIASNPANREAGQNLQEALNAKKLRTSFEEGTRYLASEEYEKAVEKFDFVYSKTPHSRTMLTRLCEALEQIGKTEEAISRYQTFIKNNPRAVDFYVKIGDLYSGKGNYAKAVTMYNIYLSKHTKDIKVGMKVADSYLLMGNDKEALATYRKFAKFEEGNLELREKMVALYLKAGNKKSALIELGSLVEKSNIVAKDAEYLYQMGKIFLEQQAYRDALIKFKKCNNTLPGYKDVAELIHDLKWKQFVPILILLGVLALLPLLKFVMGFRLSFTDLFKQDQKGKLHKKIAAYKQQGLWGKVIAEYEKYQKLPLGITETRDMLQDLSNAHLKLEHFDEAMSTAERLLSIDKQNRIALSVLGKSYLGKGELEKAITQCKIVFETDPENGSMHDIFQETYRRSGRLNELLVEYEDMTASFPDSMFLRNIYLKIEREVAGSK